METKFQVSIHPTSAKEDWPFLPKTIQDRIGRNVTAKLATYPQLYGKPLRSGLKNNWKLRIGDFRVIYSIQKNKVNIWAIGHRSVIYAIALKRLLARL